MRPQQTGELAPGLKFAPRREAIFDYRYVIHDLRTNEWVMRYRELLGDRLLDWAGPDESRFEPPKKGRDEEYLSRSAAILRGTGWYESGVDDDASRGRSDGTRCSSSATARSCRRRSNKSRRSSGQAPAPPSARPRRGPRRSTAQP